MDTAVVYFHNAELEQKELVALFDVVGFNRLREWSLDNIEAILENTDYYILAKQQGTLVGFVRLLTDWHTRGYISNLCVLPEFRHQGIGKGLMHEILSVCDKKKILVLNVYDTSGNPTFYIKFGFGADVTAVGLHRVLPGAKVP